MKKIIILAIALVMALSLLTACGEKDNGGTGSTGGNSNTPGTSSTAGNNNAASTEWPENKYTAGLPKPSGEILDVAVADKYGYTTVDMKWTKEEAQTYGEALTAAGVPGLGDMGDTQYAFTRDMSSDADPYFNGYLVEVKPYDDCYRISISTPDE